MEKSAPTTLEEAFEDVADDFQVSSRTIFRWINNFKDDGIEGLKGGIQGQRRSNLPEDQKELVIKWVKEGIDPNGMPVNWTLEALRKAIKQHLNASISLMPLWLMLKNRNCKIQKGITV